MDRGPQGRIVIRRTSPEPFQAFLPKPLPPNPPIELSAALQEGLDRANLALGRLDGAAIILPEVSLFLYSYVRKEAVLSSQIEGTQSSLSDLLLFEANEAPGVPLDDVAEVSRYVAALQFGLERLRADAPLTSRLLREIHAVLLADGRGRDQRPGEFRQSQNWIGGTRPGNATFVPPPHEEIGECMSELEKFIHDVHGRTPILVKAALAHVQFETIHPFLDGNGRLGRLLITLLLCYERALTQPLLYLSLYFKTRRARYYELLQKVRLQGDWEEWLQFFLEGVRETAEGAASTAQRIVRLFERDRARVADLPRVPPSIVRVLGLLQAKPLISIPAASRELQLAQPTVTAALHALERVWIVKEITGRRRDRAYVYDEYLKLLSEGTEPIR